jgi:8-oxo-dGTP pyrophosphatase MutT (NUDIX family)
VIKKINSSGAFFLSKSTRRFLLLQKSSGKKEGTWGLVGGKSEPDESAWQGLQREITEEIGFFPNLIKTIPLETFVSDDSHFNFQTYICIVENEFIPKLSNEHRGWAWCEIDSWPKPVHQGIKNTVGSKITRAKIETIFDLLDSISSKLPSS